MELISKSLGFAKPSNADARIRVTQTIKFERWKGKAQLAPTMTTVFFMRTTFLTRPSGLGRGYGKPCSKRSSSNEIHETSVSQSTVTFQQIVQHADQKLKGYRGLGDIRLNRLRSCRHRLDSTRANASSMLLVHRAAHGLCLQAYVRDLGISLPLIIASDRSCAKACASRRASGEQRYVQTR